MNTRGRPRIEETYHGFNAVEHLIKVSRRNGKKRGRPPKEEALLGFNAVENLLELMEKRQAIMEKMVEYRKTRYNREKEMLRLIKSGKYVLMRWDE